MNIIYAVDKNNFSVASINIYIGFMIVAILLLIYYIWKSSYSKNLKNV